MSIVINALHTSSSNWLTTLPNPSVLNDLQFEKDCIRDSINLTDLKNEQLADNVIKPVYSAIVRKERPLNSERKKLGKK